MNSVVNQTYTKLQIICVNDGSTDDSLQILEKYAATDKRVQIITQNNSGISAARNRGLTEVKGDYVMFLDSDDWIDLNTVEIARRCIIEKEVDIVLWGYKKEYRVTSIPIRIWNNERKLDGSSMAQLNIRLIGLLDPELKNPALLDSIGTAWGKLYKSHLFSVSNTKFTDTKIIGSAEDVLFNIELFAYAKSAYFSNETWYHYRKDNATSLTKTYKRELTSQWQNLFNRIPPLIEKFHLGDSAYAALENRKALALIGLGLNELSNKDINGWDGIRMLLKTTWLHSAIVKLNIRALPFHWHFFYWCARNQFYIPVFFMLKSIRLLINRS